MTPFKSYSPAYSLDGLSKVLTTFGLFALISSLALGLGACSKSGSESAPPQNDIITVDLDLNVGALKQAESDPQKVDLLSRIERKEPIPVQVFLDLILKDHVKNSRSFGNAQSLRTEDIQALLSQAIDEAKSSDPVLLKTIIETQQKQRTKTDVLYNSEATSVLNFFRDNRLQCYSGTVLNTLVYKQSLKGKADSTRTPIIIYESGHVLPGFIVPTPEKSYRMYGIESTASGRALIDYGLTHEIHVKVPKSLRVILMNDFLVLESIKSSLSLNDDEGKKLLKSATFKLKAYGLNIEELEKRISDPAGFNKIIPANKNLSPKDTLMTAENTKPSFVSNIALNASPLGFGQSDENGQDKTRSDFDITKPTEESTVVIVDTKELIPENTSLKNDLEIELPANHSDEYQVYESKDNSHSFLLLKEGTSFFLLNKSSLEKFKNVISVAFFDGPLIALRKDGSVVTRERLHGILNSPLENPLPNELKNVISVSVTYNDFAALKNDGTVVIWNHYTDNRHYSLQSELKNVISIIASGGFFAALKKDGSVVSWDPSSGHKLPLPVELRDVKSIAASQDNHVFAALKKDGSVVTWGEHENGGDSSSVQSKLKNVISIAASHTDFVALKKDGAVVTWGASEKYSEWTEGRLRDAVSIVGYNIDGFAALKKDGTVVTTGSGDVNGCSLDRELKEVVSVFSSSHDGFAAFRKDGTVVWWMPHASCMIYHRVNP